MSDSIEHRRATRIELFAVFAGLILLIVAQLLSTGMLKVWFHPPWLDECLTHLLASDPSFTHAMSAIRGGVETNPPTLYFFLWPLARLIDADIVTLRAFTATTMLLALVGVYAINRLFFDRLPALVGTLVVSSHPIVIAQMFEARFYGPWLAATTWFVYSILIEPSDSSRGARLRLTIIRCGLAMLLATIHWFGVIVLVLVAGTAACGAANAAARTLRGPRSATPQAALLALTCGLLASLACLPFFLGQREGLSVPTWIDPLTFRVVARVAKHVVFVPAMGALLGLLAWRIVAKDPLANVTQHLRQLAPVLVLLIFPGVIVLISLLVQPALIDRYVIVTVVPLGVLVALLAPRSKWINAAVVVGLVIVGGYEFRRLNEYLKVVDGRTGNGMTVTRETIDRGGPVPVIFRERAGLYPLLYINPDVADSVATLDFDGTPDPSIAAKTLYERDMARRVSRFYPQYKLIPIEQLREMRNFIVMTPEDELADLQRVLPGFRIKRRSAETYEVQK